MDSTSAVRRRRGGGRMLSFGFCAAASALLLLPLPASTGLTVPGVMCIGAAAFVFHADRTRATVGSALPRSLVWAGVSILALAQALDVVTTLWPDADIHEANPSAAAVLSQGGGLLLIACKAIITLSVWLVATVAPRRVALTVVPVAEAGVNNLMLFRTLG